MIPANEWHHVCFTFNGGVLKLFYDGVQYNTDDRSSTGQYMGVRGLIGSIGMADNDNYFGGALSDFRIYATALSAEDVLALYNNPESIANNGSMLTQGEFVEQ